MLRVVSPFDQSLVCELPYADSAAIEAALAAAQAAARAWRRVPLDERIVLVRAGIERMRADGEAIAVDVSRQMGKPIAEARRELATMVDRAEHMLATAPAALAADVLPDKPGFARRIEHEPLGVVLDVAAWNYPLLIAVNVVVPALVAGNAVLLKHSARTPLTGRAFARAFADLGPPGLVSDLVITHAQTAGVLVDPRVDFVAFTGSVEGGREVYKTTAQRFVEVGLELGGKDPAYIAADADLARAADGVVDGACYNAGQSCCAVERIYVHRSRYDEVIDRALALIDGYRLGDPLADATTMGPLASRGALDLLERQVADAVGRGARLLSGGRRIDGAGNFFPPTLLVDVPQVAEVMQEESFGPLVPIAPVDSDDEALARMNDSRYGLTASVWTADRERAERMARELEAGTVYQNRCDYLDPALPWTGVKDSGKGSTLSRYGFLQLTRRKSIHFRLE